MATPKRKSPKSKTSIRKKLWRNKAKKKVYKALIWAKVLLKND